MKQGSSGNRSSNSSVNNSSGSKGISSTLLALITVAIWSTTATTVKLLMASIPNLEALCVSSFFAFLFLLALNLVSPRRRALMRQYRPVDYAKMAGLGFLGLFLYSALYYYGIGRLSAQVACIVNYLWPIMLVLFSCLLLHERLTLPKIAGLALSFAGIVVLSLGGGAAGGSGGFAAGVAACVIAAACYGLFCVLNKKAAMDQNITMMIIWLTTAVCSCLLGLITSAVPGNATATDAAAAAGASADGCLSASLISGKIPGSWTLLSAPELLGLLWLGVVVDAAAYLFWAIAVNNAKETALVSNLAYLVPFLSVLLSAVVLKERLTMSAFAALLLIVAGVLVQEFVKPRNNGQNL